MVSFFLNCVLIKLNASEDVAGGARNRGATLMPLSFSLHVQSITKFQSVYTFSTLSFSPYPLSWHQFRSHHLQA